MPAKKRSSAEKDLEKTVRKLRAQLERSDAKAKHWKKKAGQADKAVATSQTRVKKLERRLEKASAPAARSVEEPAASEETAVSEEPSATAGPDSSWTVVQLRAEARSRGLSGLSNKSKAQLLEALG
jgi:chromosome segregation ATPase